MGSFILTKEQSEAVEYEGAMVVSACPGSGKTEIVIQKIRRVTPTLSEHKGVIAISFTRKASSELKSRCIKDGLNIKQSFFGTIDSFCYKELIVPFLSRIWAGKPNDCKVLKRLCEKYREKFTREYTSPTVSNLDDDSGFRLLFEDGVLWMNSFSALATMILKRSTAARNFIRAKYSHVFIDEYQDSSDAQHELFTCLCEIGLTGVAVGDVNQSIYGFRGGRPELLESLINMPESFKHFSVNVNHRCHPSIVNYASRLLDPNFVLIDSGGDIRVWRNYLNGTLRDAGATVARWVEEWLSKGSISKMSSVAVLAKKERSLQLFCSGFNCGHRLYIDSPLAKIGSNSSDLYADLIGYRYGSIKTAQEIIDRKIERLNSSRVNGAYLRSTITSLRGDLTVEEILSKCNGLASLLGLDDLDEADDALIAVLNSEEYIKTYSALDASEVQVMTLHKSKGLEFKIVIHLDMEEWSFPHRIPGKDWNDVVYTSLEQDTNSHYVGITRAEELCVLIRSSKRQKSNGEFGNSSPSYFLNRPQLNGLYQ